MKKNRKVKRKLKDSKKEKRIELNSKELKINLEKLRKDVKKVSSSMRKLLPESIDTKKIKSFGNASHIVLPKEYAGKRATVIIKK